MHPSRFLGVLLLAASGLASQPADARDRERGSPPPPPSPAQRLPVPFEPNAGQADPAVRFLARGRGFLLLLTDDGAVFSLRDGTALRMGLAGEGPSSRFVPGSRLPGVSNYFIGNDPAKWRREVPHFRSIVRRCAAPGTDLRWRGDRGGVEYEAVMAPGAGNRTLAFSMEGAEGIEVDAGGALLVRTRGGVLRQSRPVAFQDGSGGRLPIPARFVTEGSRRFRIEAGPCDPALPLFVDPRVEFSTYLGGGAADYALAGTVDASGAVYLAGYTGSTDFPVASAFQGTLAGNNDAVVTKLSPSGASLVYSTFLGGSNGSPADDVVLGIAVDAGGAAYVAGRTLSGNFPTVGAIQSTLQSSDDAFVAKLGASGSQLVYSTYLGGNSNDGAYAIAVDATGAAFVGGYTASTTFPGAGTFLNAKSTGFDGFVAKFAPSGSSLAWGTYIGGSGAEWVNGIAVDSTGAAYLAGQTDSTNFPLQGAFQAAYGGVRDAFVAKLGSTGASLVYSSYLGGTGSDSATAVVVDGNGIATVVGAAGASGLPLQNPLYGTHGGGGNDAFVARVAADGGSLLSSSYFGGSGADIAWGVTLDAAGSIYVAGSTGSTAGFPLVSATQGTYGGGTLDAFLLKLNASATVVAYSTYLGGTSSDEARAVAVRGTEAFVAGWTTSTDFPTQGAYQGNKGSGTDAFLVKLISTSLPPSDAYSSLIAVDGIELIWTDNSTDEIGFEIQRKVGAGAFAPLATVAAGTTVHDDTGLATGTKYTYRVRAVNFDGPSGWTNEATTTTPPAIPGVPLSPSGLEATLVSSARVDLSWTDESDDENFFQVQRRTGTGLWQVLATPGPGATAYSDTTTLPDRSYAYRVRAANLAGYSDYSVEAAVVSPPTIGFALVKGSVKDSVKAGRDALKIRGTLALNGDSPDGTYDPSADGFEIRLGGREGIPLLGLLPGAEGWVLRKGVYTWKSPKGSATKATVAVDPVKGTWSLVLLRANLPAFPANPVVLSMALGNDAGTRGDDWTDPPKKPGVLKFP